MRRDKNKISVILPTYNEAESIVPLIYAINKNLKNVRHEIIVVDDNSSDATGRIARKKFSQRQNIKIYIRKKSKGLATAIKYGIKRSAGTIVAVMDTDFNHDPNELPKMYNLIKNYDMIVGSRYVKGGGMENRWRFMLSLIYNRLIKFILGLPTYDNLSGFYMIKRDSLNLIYDETIFTGYGDYFLRLQYWAHRHQLKIYEIPVFYKNRIYGVSKSKFIQMFFDYTKTVLALISSKSK